MAKNYRNYEDYLDSNDGDDYSHHIPEYYVRIQRMKDYRAYELEIEKYGKEKHRVFLYGQKTGGQGVPKTVL